MGLLQDEGFGRLQCSYGQVGPEGSLVSVPALRVPDENNSGSLRNMECYPLINLRDLWHNVPIQLTKALHEMS